MRCPFAEMRSANKQPTGYDRPRRRVRSRVRGPRIAALCVGESTLASSRVSTPTKTCVNSRYASISHPTASTPMMSSLQTPKPVSVTGRAMNGGSLLAATGVDLPPADQHSRIQSAAALLAVRVAVSEPYQLRTLLLDHVQASPFWPVCMAWDIWCCPLQSTRAPLPLES